jgi:8-oxo-dGTP pyrophosphatase MutT (NUDIX family)
MNDFIRKDYNNIKLNIVDDNYLKYIDTLYCNNCGKFGHIYRKCREPITSIGIVLFKIEDIDFNIFLKKYNNFINYNSNNNYISIKDYNFNNLNNIKYFKNIAKKVKFLLVRRKNTLGYIEFMRGRYDISDVDTLISLFEQMTEDEIGGLLNNNFKDLWDDLWKSSENEHPPNLQNLYKNEYEQSKKKFNLLKTIEKHPNLLFYTKYIKPKYNNPEWGFPKGRRDNVERNIECAKRELYEETGYRSVDYYLLKKLTPLQEVLLGTNYIEYKHIYYTGIINSNKIPIIDEMDTKTREIGKISWVSYKEALQLIRPYHHNKINILNELLLLITDIIMNF